MVQRRAQPRPLRPFIRPHPMLVPCRVCPSPKATAPVDGLEHIILLCRLEREDSGTRSDAIHVGILADPSVRVVVQVDHGELLRVASAVPASLWLSLVGLDREGGGYSVPRP